MAYYFDRRMPPYNKDREKKEVFIFGEWVSLKEAKQIVNQVQLPMPNPSHLTWTSSGSTCEGTCGVWDSCAGSCSKTCGGGSCNQTCECG